MYGIDLSPLWLSLRVATLSTLVVVLAGVALGWLLARRRFFGREALDAAVTLPLVLPPTVLGYYLLVLLGRGGPVGRAYEWLTGAQLVFTWRGAVVAAAAGALPLMVKTARAAVAGVDTQYEDAARTLGKSEWHVFRRVTLPLASRGLLAGAMLAFARALGDFGATLMVAGNIPGRTQTLPLAVYDAVQARRYDEANVMLLVLTSLAFAGLWCVRRLEQPRHRRGDAMR